MQEHYWDCLEDVSTNPRDSRGGIRTSFFYPDQTGAILLVPFAIADVNRASVQIFA